MTDRHRFSKRSRELIVYAQTIEDLSRMPDRMTEKDLQLAVKLMRSAASDLDELASATPAGCVCRRIEGDDYSYLDYAQSCTHHASLYLKEQHLKTSYAKMEKTLKNEVRMKLVATALSGTAGLLGDPDDPALVKRAIAIADATIRQITETA